METKILIIPEYEFLGLKNIQQQILEKLESLTPQKNKDSPYITSLEFMDAVRIRRTKFDQLVDQNKIETLKKGRKIYVKASEVERYFSDKNIK